MAGQEIFTFCRSDILHTSAIVEIGGTQSHGNRVATEPSRKTRSRQTISVPTLFNRCILFIQENVLTLGLCSRARALTGSTQPEPALHVYDLK